jgi:DNA-binding MarR family transcriptional regulator
MRARVEGENALKKSPRTADVYLRFLQLSEAIRGLPALPPLDPLEERILSWVAAQQGDRLSVRDMMGREEIGSRATIHGRLKSLRAKGWIVLAATEDARRKQIELTSATLEHFARLSRCIVEAARH